MAALMSIIQAFLNIPTSCEKLMDKTPRMVIPSNPALLSGITSR
jgi:hypothetical protein